MSTSKLSTMARAGVNEKLEFSRMPKFCKATPIAFSVSVYEARSEAS